MLLLWFYINLLVWNDLSHPRSKRERRKLLRIISLISRVNQWTVELFFWKLVQRWGFHWSSRPSATIQCHLVLHRNITQAFHIIRNQSLLSSCWYFGACDRFFNVDHKIINWWRGRVWVKQLVHTWTLEEQLKNVGQGRACVIPVSPDVNVPCWFLQNELYARKNSWISFFFICVDFFIWFPIAVEEQSIDLYMKFTSEPGQDKPGASRSEWEALLSCLRTSWFPALSSLHFS